MDKPPYIERGGEQCLAHPFVTKDVQWFGFVVKAEKKALTTLCDRYLNKPLGTENFVPAVGHVMFVCNRLGKMYSKNPPDRNRGWYTEQEGAIWMLVLDKERHNLFWFQPYMIVDNSYAMASGREIYGFPKQYGRLTIPDGPDAPDALNVEASVVRELTPDSKATYESLFKVTLAQKAMDGPAHKEHDVRKELVEDIVEALEIGEDFLSDFELDRNLYEDLLHLRIPLVFLKQIRDSAEPDKACYQVVQECATTMTRFHNARLYFHAYDIEFEDYASHPIRKDFGLPKGAIRADVAFWAKFDAEFGLCNVVGGERRGGGPKKKIAILGGGMSAVTAAMQLSEEGWRERFESITLYQMGWRLGGKGATGRGDHGSIEEHGLHIWLGFYENAFKLIREIYDWARRPQGSKLATWEEAFEAHDYIGVDQKFEGDWEPWMFDFPQNSGIPGEGGELPTLKEYIEMLIGWIGKLYRPKTIAGWAKWLLKEVGRRIGLLPKGDRHALVENARARARLVHDEAHHSTLIDTLHRLGSDLEAELAADADLDLTARRILILMNMGATIAKGMLKERIFSSEDLEKLEGIDFSDWLKKHSALELVWSIDTNPLLRGMYDFAFAYEDGDTKKGNFATSPALRTIFRMVFTYKGAIFWKMTAGMGDSIFAPAYQALINRGVDVKFFHKVQNLGLSEDKTSIATIDVDVQATTKSGKPYEPLFDQPVEGGTLPCWPNHPLYDQLNEGDELQRQKVDLESFWTTWEGKTKTLKVGEDFDTVVFGISLASVPYLCKELIDASTQWQNMVKNVATVRTQALQLWLTPDIAMLGWTAKSPIIDAWIQPLSTWADMSILTKYENWEADEPGSTAYFCGPMAGGIPPKSDTDTPEKEHAKVVKTSEAMLSGPINTLWKALGDTGLPSSDVKLRYCRANIDPSQRYVMSLAGSADYRLRANEAGFSNLVLTGDWIRNGYNAGCIEASAWSGIQAANAVLGRPLNDGVIS